MDLNIVSIYKNAYQRNQYQKSSLQLLFWQFNQSKKLETGNILIDKKDYKNLVIYFTRYVQSKLIKMLILHYHEFIGRLKNMKKKIFDG